MTAVVKVKVTDKDIIRYVGSKINLMNVKLNFIYFKARALNGTRRADKEHAAILFEYRYPI